MSRAVALFREARQADDTTTVGGSGDQSKHPHGSAGSGHGGQFVKNNSGGSKPKAVAPKAAAKPGAPQQHGVLPPPTTSRTMKLGQSGDDVRNLQYAMGLLGFQVPQDGTFDAHTQAAVAQAQQRLGIKPNGHASASLLRKMQDAVRLSPCVKESTMTGAVRLFQIARTAERFDPAQPRDDHGRWSLFADAIALLRKGGHDKAASHLEEAQVVSRRSGTPAERHAKYRHDVIDAERLRTEVARLDEQHSARLFPGSRMEDPENRRLNRAQAAQRRAELAPLESRIAAHEHFFGTHPPEEDHVGTAQSHVDALQAPSAPKAAPSTGDFGPGGAKHIDARQVGDGLNVDTATLDRVQRALDEGKSPRRVARDLREASDGDLDLSALMNGGSKGVGNGELAGRHASELDAARHRHAEESRLADRLEAMRRPSAAKKASPAAARMVNINGLEWDLNELEQESGLAGRSPADLKKIAYEANIDIPSAARTAPARRLFLIRSAMEHHRRTGGGMGGDGEGGLRHLRSASERVPGASPAAAKMARGKAGAADRAEAAKVASAFHEDWRKTRLQSDGSFEPRVKTTKDQAWIGAHGTDQVDIANSTYDQLPEDWKAENKAAAEVVQGILKQHGGTVDLSDEKTRLAVGEEVHQAWLSRNEWAKGGELDVPFADLTKSEQDKDTDQLKVAMAALSGNARPRTAKKASTPARTAGRRNRVDKAGRFIGMQDRTTSAGPGKLVSITGSAVQVGEGDTLQPSPERWGSGYNVDLIRPNGDRVRVEQSLSSREQATARIAELNDHLGRGPAAVPKTAAATPGPSHSPAVAKMARAKAAPAKKAAKAAVDPRAVADLADQANQQPPGPGRVPAISATMEGLNGTQLRAVARELGVKIPPRMTPDAMREFIARSLDVFGS